MPDERLKKTEQAPALREANRAEEKSAAFLPTELEWFFINSYNSALQSLKFASSKTAVSLLDISINASAVLRAKLPVLLTRQRPNSSPNYISKKNIQIME